MEKCADNRPVSRRRITLALILDVILFLLGRHRRGIKRHQQEVCTRVSNEDLWFCAKGYAVFIVGFVIQMLFVGFVKNQLGFLRPNFMDVCRPQFNEIQSLCPARYITEYTCTGHYADDIIDSRQSFSSGHSTFAMYVAIFFSFYIQRRLHIRFSRILKFFLQAALVFTASFCGLSRISDHKHHISDVIVGFAFGSIVAEFVV